MTSIEKEQPSLGEEIANSVTHGLGAALSIAGLVVLVVAAALRGDAWKVVSAAIYGASLVILYGCSTLYHAFPPGRAKRFFKVLDHSAIYVLIAGTYTPFTLVTLRGGWGWSLFGVVWGLALGGVLFKCFFIQRLKVLSTCLYVAMGWVVLIALQPLLRALPLAGFLLLLGGGLCYTAGVLFFSSRRKWAHAVWHLFVLGGSLLHYATVLSFVII